MKKFLFILLAVFVFVTEVNAASKCSYQEQTELNSKAANIKVMYEAKEDVTDNSFGDEVLTINFEVSVLNVTDEFYVVMTNNNNNDKKTFTSSDISNGLIKFIWNDTMKVNNLEFEVFTSNNTSCKDESVRKIYVTLPRYNEYSISDICNDASDFSMCQRYVTLDEFDFEKLKNEVNKYKKNNNISNNNQENKDKGNELNSTNVFEEYKWYIIGGIAGVSLATIAIALGINKNKKQRDLEI